VRPGFTGTGDKISTFTPSGAIAQLGERIVRNDEVVGSIPTSSTNLSTTCGIPLGFCSRLSRPHPIERMKVRQWDRTAVDSNCKDKQREIKTRHKARHYTLENE
jgi:hypothetical protein